MILIAVSFPLGLLCLYIGCIGWRRNRRASAILLLFAALNIGFTLVLATIVLFFSDQLGFL